MDSLILSDSRVTAEAKRLEEDLQRITVGMLRTLWDYAEQKPSTLFILLDFSRGEAVSFVGLGKTLVFTDELSTFEGPGSPLDPTGPSSITPEKEASLSEYFTRDMEEIRDVFARRGKRVPTLLWGAYSVKNETYRQVVDFTLDGAPSRQDPRESALKWMERLRAHRVEALVIHEG